MQGEGPKSLDGGRHLGRVNSCSVISFRPFPSWPSVVYRATVRHEPVVTRRRGTRKGHSRRAPARCPTSRGEGQCGRSANTSRGPIGTSPSRGRVDQWGSEERRIHCRRRTGRPDGLPSRTDSTGNRTDNTGGSLVRHGRQGLRRLRLRHLQPRPRLLPTRRFPQPSRADDVDGLHLREQAGPVGGAGRPAHSPDGRPGVGGGYGPGLADVPGTRRPAADGSAPSLCQRLLAESWDPMGALPLLAPLPPRAGGVSPSLSGSGGNESIVARRVGDHPRPPRPALPAASARRSLVGPPAETGVQPGPRPVPLGHLPPGHSGTELPHEPVEDRPVVPPHPVPRPDRQQRPNELPLKIGQFMAT